MAYTLAQLPDDMQRSGFARTALSLARKMDDPSTSATAFSMLAGQLHSYLDRLQELKPPAEEVDDLDELAKRRDARRAGSAAASDQ